MISNKYTSAYKKIRKAENILIVTHNKPDGDALSSTCAMIDLLESIGKKYLAFCHDAPPRQFNFLPHVEKISANRENLNFIKYDLIIVLDCGSLNRTLLTEEIRNKKGGQLIIEFDHHPKIDDYANIEIRIPKYSSTAEVLYNFFKSNKIKINKNIANCLLTGILTDTGNLLFESTTDKTVQIASEMLTKGARFPLILEGTWRNKSLGAMKIWGQAMRNLKINKKFDFAYTAVTYDEFMRSGATDEEFEGAPGFLSNLDGVKALLVLREVAPGKIKGSLRSTYPNIDISPLAHALGGGGHARASGFMIPGHIEKTPNGWRIV